MNWVIEKLVSKGDYLYAIVRNHPNRTKNNYVLHHRIVMENHIGRLLTSEEIIHHKNENKKDNSISKLEILTHKTHGKLHASQRPSKKTIELVCNSCFHIFVKPFNQYKPHNQNQFCSVQCYHNFLRGYQQPGCNEAGFYPV